MDNQNGDEAGRISFTCKNNDEEFEELFHITPQGKIILSNQKQDITDDDHAIAECVRKFARAYSEEMNNG